MTSRIIQRIVAGVMASTIGTTVYLVACDGNPQNCSKGDALNDAIKKAEDLCKKIKEESGSPGLVAGVSVDGTNVLNIGTQLMFSFTYHFTIFNQNFLQALVMQILKTI